MGETQTMPTLGEVEVEDEEEEEVEEMVIGTVDPVVPPGSLMTSWLEKAFTLDVSLVFCPAE